MDSNVNKVYKALIIGTVITLLLFGAAFIAADIGLTELSYLLYWQGYILGMLVPCKEVIILGVAQCEVTTIGIVAFYAGIPIGILVYSLLAYIPLALFKK